MREPQSSPGPQYQSFSIFDNTVYDLYEEPRRIGFRTSSARDEGPRASAGLHFETSETPPPRSRDEVEADRLSTEFHSTIFAHIEAEKAVRARAIITRRKSYAKYDLPPQYPFDTGVSIEDPQNIIQGYIPPDLVCYTLAVILKRGGRLIFDSSYPPVCGFLTELEARPDLLQVVTGNGRNTKEWTSSHPPEWYTRVLEARQVTDIDRVCFVAAALSVYDKKPHPAHRLFWNNFTCRTRSGTIDKQAVWERSVEKIRELLSKSLFFRSLILTVLTDEFLLSARGKYISVKGLNCATLWTDLRELENLSGNEWQTRAKKLFPTRWSSELGIVDGLSRNVLPSSPKTKKHAGRTTNSGAALRTPPRKSTRVAAAAPDTEPQTKKRKAEDNEQPADASAVPVASPRKRGRIVRFIEPSRKSSVEGKPQTPPVPASDDGRTVRKRVNTGKVPSAMKKATSGAKNTTPVVNTKTICLVREVNTDAFPSNSRSRPATQLQLSPPKKANVILPPSKLGTTLNPPPLIVTTVPLLPNRSNSAESGYSGSSTAISPASGHSRNSSNSLGTAVESHVSDSKDQQGKRKRVDESQDADVKVAEGIEATPRRSTRASILTSKAAVAISEVQLVEDGGASRKRRKTVNPSRKA